MPELPEVETVRRSLDPALSGRRIEAVRVTRDRAVRRQAHDEFTALLRGRTFERVRRHGKFLIFDLGDNEAMIGHLRMSGQLRIAMRDDDMAKHTHVVFDLDDGSQLRFVDPRTFGELYVDALHGDRPQSLSHLGPDALERRTLTRLVGSRNIKSVLLDQTVVAGVGNIYADEALFAARLHPQRVASTITPDEVGLLRRELGKILRAAIRSRGTSFDFAYPDGGFRPKIYGRSDQPCVRCGAPITKLVVAQRGTHVCRVCQPFAN